MRPKELIYRLISIALPACPPGMIEKSVRSLNIVMAHGIHTSEMSLISQPPGSSTSLSSLLSNILALRKFYKIISLDEGVSMLCRQSEWSDRCVVLTFDDSLKCLATIAAPLLSQYNVPATFFISTSAIDNQEPYWWLRYDYAVTKAAGKNLSFEFANFGIVNFDKTLKTSNTAELKKFLRDAPPSTCNDVLSLIEAKLLIKLEDFMECYPFARPMTWSCVKKLISLKMTVGSHSQTHQNLTLLAPHALTKEVACSRRIIENNTQTSCHHFCYPYGQFSNFVIEEVKKSKYISAVTTNRPGWNDRDIDVYKLQRFPITSDHHKLPYFISGLESLING